jgi:hypothetical protein
MPVKRLVVNPSEIMEGDLVESKDETASYFVLKIGKTMLHNHKFLEVVYNDGHEFRLYLHDMEGKRVVFRNFQKAIA